MPIVVQIKQIQGWSQAAWGTAIDTAGPEYSGGSAERQEAMRELAESCDAAYDAAIETLEGQYENWAQNAKHYLEEAKGYESEGGDSSHATMALEALKDYLTENV
jgi:hypothetical protein